LGMCSGSEAVSSIRLTDLRVIKKNKRVGVGALHAVALVDYHHVSHAPLPEREGPP
jgi:hypothetical protein